MKEPYHHHEICRLCGFRMYANRESFWPSWWSPLCKLPDKLINDRLQQEYNTIRNPSIDDECSRCEINHDHGFYIKVLEEYQAHKACIKNHTIQQFVGLLGAILMRKKKAEAQAEAEAKALSLIMPDDYVDMGVHENSCDLCKTRVVEIDGDGYDRYDYGTYAFWAPKEMEMKLMLTTPVFEWSDDLIYKRIRREMGQAVHEKYTDHYTGTEQPKLQCNAVFDGHSHIETAHKLWEFRAHRHGMVQNTIQQFVGLMAAIKVRRDCVKHKINQNTNK
jgi:hypothetical protein